MKEVGGGGGGGGEGEEQEYLATCFRKCHILKPKDSRTRKADVPTVTPRVAYYNAKNLAR